MAVRDYTARRPTVKRLYSVSLDKPSLGSNSSYAAIKLLIARAWMTSDLLGSVFFIVFVALTLRLAVVVLLYHQQLSPGRDYFHFGWEIGRVARSIASGYGFGSPLFAETGPTAMVTPLYTFLLALVFKLFGVYTAQSAMAILSLNSLFSALTCLPIFFIARQTFGSAVAVRAAWVWAFFPYAIDFAAARVWGDCLNALLLSIIFLIALSLQQTNSIAGWLLFGLLSGLAALNCPTIISTLPFLAALACYRLKRSGKKYTLSMSIAAIAMVVMVSPWLVRNQLIYKQFIPFRDNFWLEMYIGNTGDTSDIVPDWTHPATSKEEMEKFRQMGELAYMSEKRRQTIDFIATHPLTFLWLSVRRMVYIWTGFWSFSAGYLGLEPFAIPNMIFCSMLTAVMMKGLWSAWRKNREVAMNYAVVLISYPMIYYITHPTMDYRHPIDPLIIVLAMYAVRMVKDGVRQEIVVFDPGLDVST